MYSWLLDRLPRKEGERYPSEETVAEMRSHLFAPIPGRVSSSQVSEELEADAFAAFASQMGMSE